MKTNRTIKFLQTFLGVLIFVLLLPVSMRAQDSITLDYCYSLAEKNYPLRQQLAMLGNSNELKVQNLNKNYLPQVNINGGASLQSDVTQVAIDLPKGLPELTMPTLSKDWYKLTLDVNQVIYDGNVTHYQKQVEVFTLQADRKAVEIELYKLKERINQIYFGIILLDQNESLLKSNKERIDAKLMEVRSGIRNGAHRPTVYRNPDGPKRFLQNAGGTDLNPHYRNNPPRFACCNFARNCF
jgi:outer membrane protein TolC